MVTTKCLDKKLIEYYHIFLQYHGIDYKNRLLFLNPDPKLTSIVPSYLPLSKLMFYSTKSKKIVKKFIGDEFAYIIPGYHHNNDILLSNFWKIPILMGNMENHRTLSLKSGAYQLFKEM